MDQQAAFTSGSDCWSDWLLRRRHGGDAAYEAIVRAEVTAYRDRVLDGAQLTSGMTLLDVGSGEGLIAFGALERIRQPFSVILTDISAPLLAHAERTSMELGLRQHCSFFQASAETLAGIPNESVDVLTSRAVLAYLADKPSAARNFLRVLKPGGRVSLCEPIGLDAAVQLAALTNVLQSEPANSTTPYLAILQRCRALQTPSTLSGIRSDPLTNFTERNLVQLFQKTGFTNIHMEFHIDVKAGTAIPWSTFIDIAPRPGAPSLREVFQQSLTSAEIDFLERCMRPFVENGTLMGQSSTAYLTAEKRK
jgi:ubiquinone/menaquinone biosynthesis C-methylase UbiE